MGFEKKKAVGMHTGRDVHKKELDSAMMKLHIMEHPTLKHHEDMISNVKITLNPDTSEAEDKDVLLYSNRGALAVIGIKVGYVKKARKTEADEILVPDVDENGMVRGYYVCNALAPEVKKIEDALAKDPEIIGRLFRKRMK